MVSIANRLFGEREYFAMENRMFSMASFCISFILAGFLVIDAVLKLWQQSAIVCVVLICQLIFYYYSRKKKKFRVSIIIDSIIAYAALAINYFIDAGIDGPTIFLFFFTIHVLIACTPAKLHIWWLGFHIIVVVSMLTATLMKPELVQRNYNSITGHYVDVLVWYLITLFLLYIITNYLKNYYLKEKRVTESLQTKLKAFFDQSSNAHVLLDAKGFVIYCNSAARDFLQIIYGIEIEQGKQVTGFLLAGEEQNFKDSFGSALNGHVIEDEKIWTNGHLGQTWWQVSFVPAKDFAGHIIGVSFNATNISARRQNEEELKARNYSLLRIAHMQSNDLRQPVKELEDLMKSLEGGGTSSEKYLDLMYEQAQELDNKIRDIVAKTKIS